MARKIYYRISDDGTNKLTDDQWEEIARVQHWYNSEFFWTAGKLGFRLFAVFPRTDGSVESEALIKVIHERHKELRHSGFSESDAIRRMEEEGLIFSQKGGYFRNCLASGFTRVAGNEYNAYLVCEFLLKASVIAEQSKIVVRDEGEFIKSKCITLYNGSVYLNRSDEINLEYLKHLAGGKQVFSIVNPSKYNEYPVLKNNIPDFNEMEPEERRGILKDWNWLGYGNNYDEGGNDLKGSDLNKKVANFFIMDEKDNLEIF